MQVVHAFAVLFTQPAEGSIVVPLKTTRRELGLDPGLDNTRFVLFPACFLPPLLLLLFIAAVSTRWHQPTGPVL